MWVENGSMNIVLDGGTDVMRPASRNPLSLTSQSPSEKHLCARIIGRRCSHAQGRRRNVSYESPKPIALNGG